MRLDTRSNDSENLRPIHHSSRYSALQTRFSERVQKFGRGVHGEGLRDTVRKGAKAAVIGSVFAVMVGGAGYGAFNVMSALSGSEGGGSAAATRGREDRAAERRGGQGDLDQVLRRVGAGDAAKAAAYTNFAQKAQELLAGYHDDAHLTGVKITPGAATGTTVPFSVKATVSFEGSPSPSRTTRG